MREPFAYENNAGLIRQLLVPDPISGGAGQGALSGGEKNRAGHSLLEWLVIGGTIDDGELLGSLGESLGVKTRPAGQFRLLESALPEAGLLRAQGFVELEAAGMGLIATGGPELAPDLEAYIGEAAKAWQWVLVSPLRGQGAVIQRVEEGQGRAGAYGTGTRLRELLLGLWSEGASDIHFERESGILAVRVHRDGRMHPVAEWDGPRVIGTLRLLKTWSHLSTAANPMPQDGSLRLRDGQREITFRVSHLPTENGESLVLRIPGGTSGIRPLTELGVPPGLEQAMLDTVLHDPGMLIIAGTTCSGKTTTAYSLLHGLAGRNLKILTIEDPVEYELEAALQIAVDDRNGWTFDRAIRAYLRQDPDVIFIGEIRDRKSAEAGCRAALTGHCVISTLHGRSETAVLERLAGWRLDPGTLAESLRLIVHQRLVSNGHALQAEFSWMRPEPEEILEYLTGVSLHGSTG